MYTYNWYEWLAFFYIYCFFGWIFESTYVSLRRHCLINRGFLRLPLLPIYGSGAVLILWVSLPVQDSLILVYFSGMLAATALEYVTGYVMERLFKMRYWDYSNQQFHLHGYICLSSSIAWGFLSLFLTEVIHQPIETFVLGLNPLLLIGCVFAVTIVFASDAYESTKEALELGTTLELLASIKEEMDELEAKLAVVREEAAGRLAAAKAETDVRIEAAMLHREEQLETVRREAEQRLTDLREDTLDHLITVREQAEERVNTSLENQKELLNALELRLNKLNEKRHLASHARNRLGHFYRKQLLKGNPTASSRFAEALKEIKDKLEV